jgi:hypothetical protein
VSSRTSSASPCSSSIDVSVELPQRIRSGPPCDLTRRTPSTTSGPEALRRAPCQTLRTVGRDVLLRRVEAVRHRTARRLRPVARPDVVGATAEQQIEALALRGEDRLPTGGGPVGRGPVAVGEVVVICGVLDHAVQRDVFDDPEAFSLGSPCSGVGVPKSVGIAGDSALLHSASNRRTGTRQLFQKFASGVLLRAQEMSTAGARNAKCSASRGQCGRSGRSAPATRPPSPFPH